MPARSSRTRRRKTSSARRAPSGRSSSSRKSCSTDRLAGGGRLALHFLPHHLRNAVIRIALAKLRERLVRLLVAPLLAQLGDALELALGRWSRVLSSHRGVASPW